MALAYTSKLFEGLTSEVMTNMTEIDLDQYALFDFFIFLFLMGIRIPFAFAHILIAISRK